MAAKKRSLPENLHDGESSLQQHFRRKQRRHGRQAQEEKELDDVKLIYDDEEEEEEDEIPSDPEDLDEFIKVDLTLVREDVQCGICLGIIKKTRTVMECLHRFCRQCIDKSMRLGNNECPVCRRHCASRRSLRDNSNYDAIIEKLYQNIEKYEEEERSLHEEEKNHNKKIQASIAQIYQQQSEALSKRSRTGKETADLSTTRLPCDNRAADSRRRRNHRSPEAQGSYDNEDENEQDGNKDSLSSQERRTKMKQKKCKRENGARNTQPSSTAISDGGCFDNEVEARKEVRGTSPAIMWKTEGLSWGGGGARSHTRHGSAGGSKGNRTAHLAKLVESLQNLQENDNELEVQLVLVSLDKQRTPSLQQHQHLCCHAYLSVKHLCEFVASKTPLQAKDIEMLLVKETPSTRSEQSTISTSTSMHDQIYLSQVVGQSKVGLVTLEGRETLMELQATSSRGNLILVYRQKRST